MNQFTSSLFNSNQQTAVDLIRQEYFDIFHYLENNESISEMNLDIEGKTNNFIENMCNVLNNKLQPKVLNEIVNGITSCLSAYPKYSLQCLYHFITLSKLNANYIIVTASIISEFIIAQQEINNEIIDSFVDESLDEILKQFQNNTAEMILFGHSIPQQFQNNLIINLLLPSKITKELSLLFLYNILPNFLFSKDKRFELLLQKMINSNFIDISIDNYETEREHLEMISNRKIRLTSNSNEKTLSFLTWTIFYIKNNCEEKLKRLDKHTILPIIAIMSIYIQNYKGNANFSQEFFANLNNCFYILFLEGLEILDNKSSDLLKTSFEFIFSFPDFIRQERIFSFNQSSQIFSDLATKFFTNQFKYDINLILPFLFTKSNSYLHFFKMYGMDLFDYLVKNCANIEYIRSKRINLDIFTNKKVLKYLKRLNESKSILQTVYFLSSYCDPYKFKKILDFLHQFLIDKINNESWEDVILIEKFFNKYCLNDDLQQIKNLVLPNHVLNILFGKRKYELNTDELLSCILNENQIENKDVYFKMLFDIMIEDKSIRSCYLEHLIYLNSSDYIHSCILLQKLLKEYEKYQMTSLMQ